MNIIVTHCSPDVDAICSIWLIKKFIPGFNNAGVKFVPAGNTLNNKDPDRDDSIIHVDTGFGKFDHHQTADNTSAAEKIYQFVKKQNYLTSSEIGVLKRIITWVTQIDQFHQVFKKDAASDDYDFCFDGLIDGLKLLYPYDDLKVVECGLVCMDGFFKQFTNKLWAEELIKKEGIKFKTKYGKAIAFSTVNDEVVSLAQKKGYRLVVRRDPKKNYARIKSWPVLQIDLTALYNRLKEKDPQATWFLHVSKHMVLNGSTKNPEMKPTKLSLEEIIKIIKG